MTYSASDASVTPDANGVNLQSHLQPHLQPSLYDQDYQVWLEQTVQQLRDRSYETVDWDNLIEELESLGKSHKREVGSCLTLILMHLLKWQYQPEQRAFYGRSWIATIDEQRDELRSILADSPSLKSYVLEIFAEKYAIARQRAARQTGLALETFPEASPFSTEAALDPEFMP